MKAGNYNNVPRLDPVEDPIREPPQQSSSNIAVNCWKPIGMRSYDRFHPVDSFEKLFPEPRSFAFIPAIRRPDLRRSRRTNDDWQTRLITFAHGFG
jgi:hypothetical protein